MASPNINPNMARTRSVTMTERSWMALEDAAKEDDRSVSYVVRMAVKEWLDRRAKKTTEKGGGKA